MSNPLVSVVIPSYNRPERTQRAIDSVAAQTYAPIELLVVDDGSRPPLSKKISLPDKHLYRAELLVHEENLGANFARNTGIKKASGEYVAFLDSDDEWEPEKLDRQIAVLGGDDTTIPYTSIRHKNEDGQLISTSKATLSGDLSSHLLKENVIGTFSSVVVPVHLINVTGLPNPRLPCYQDWEWYLRLSEYATFKPNPDSLTVKYSGDGQISDDFQQKYQEAYPIMREYLRNHASKKKMERMALSGLQFRMGYSALSNGKYAFARLFFIRSIRTNPKMWRSYVYLLLSGGHVNILRKVKRIAIRVWN